MLLAVWTASTRAAVVVLANRADREVSCRLKHAEGEIQTCVIAPANLAVVPVTGRAEVAFVDGDQSRRYAVDPNRAYFFSSGEGRLDLYGIGFTDQAARREDPAGTIPVKIFVDDDQPAVRKYWEGQLRKRIERVSQVLQRTCRIRLEVVDVGTWDSNDAESDFVQSLAEFEREADPGKAQLAIGFTSQYEIPPEGFHAGGRIRTHLGGTRGPLHRHVLVREGSRRISESERTEVLLHEMGHVLGAVHSPEPTSVMRPVLGDGKSRAVDFHVGFDPLNTLAMNVLGEEIRLRGVRRLDDISPEARKLLAEIYRALAKAMPEDGAVEHYLRLLRLTAPQSKLAAATQRVLRVITLAATNNHQLAEQNGNAPVRPFSGDLLTSLLVGSAATAAAKLPPEYATKAFLLALGIGLDDSKLVRDHPQLGGLIRAVESDEQRGERVKVLGSPTLRGRHDLAQHFAVSAYLTVQVGAANARTAGLFKELRDSQGGSGFSFADLAADLAGVRFAQWTQSTPGALKTLSGGFHVDRFMPQVDGLAEGLDQKAFARAYGSPSDERFQAVLDDINRRIDALEGYKRGDHEPE